MSLKLIVEEGLIRKNIKTAAKKTVEWVVEEDFGCENVDSFKQKD